MRGSLVLLLAGAASAGACVVGSFGARAQEAPRAAATASDDAVKDVEIMRRVLVRECLSARGASTAWTTDDGQGALNYYVHSFGGAGGSEAFVVGGQGATFVLRTSDAVAAGKGDETAAGGDKPNAWDEEAAAVEGRSAAARAARRIARYDAAKVEALKTRVLDCLSKYGQKVRGLAPSDRLTVIVVGGGSGATLEPQVTTTTEDGKAAARVLLASAARVDGRTVLSLHVSVADCQAAGAGTLSADEFRRRAVVSAY